MGFIPGQSIEVKGLTFKISGMPLPGDEFFVESAVKQPLTTTLKRLMDGLNRFQDTEVGGEQVKNLVANILKNLDYAQDSISEVVSKVGARANTLDATKKLIENVSIVNKEVLSKVRDVDFTEALSRLQMESFILEAAQRSYAGIENISLFNQL